MKNKNLTIASILGLLAVAFGAFGAHTLKAILSVEALQSFDTAVRYQMYHVIVILCVNMYSGFGAKTKNSISLFFFIGVLFFSGSIYAITLTTIPAKSIWFVTPLGGVLLIVGWLKLSISFIRGK